MVAPVPAANDSLPADIPPVPMTPTPDSSKSTTGLVVGLVVAGSVVVGLGAVLLCVLLRSRRVKRAQASLAEHLKQQAATERGLVRYGSGASSNGSGEHCT
jgi:hypothetical protein